MFHSVRIKNAKLTLISIGCFVILLAVCLVMLRAAPQNTVTVGDEKIGLKVSGDEDIEAFISRCGHEIEGCISDDMITVPKTWNEVYESYNELQKEQGLDLRPYKGETARRLVYAIAGTDSYVTLLVCDGRVIAADLSSMQQGDDPQPLIG